jgi:glycosyltransferase A (GT-A) superfamily protein (DUF2064 family)
LVGVFAKIPDREPVKTRLQTVLPPVEAARFQWASIADTLEAVARTGVAPCLFLAHGADERQRIGRLLLAHGLDASVWARVRLEGQQGRDLGERMTHAFAVLHERAAPSRDGATCSGGAERIRASPAGCLLLGSDSPTVTPLLIDRALGALAQADIVLGPATDGGYWCIGVRAPVAGLFTAVPWSTPATCDATEAGAHALGLRTTRVDSWSDVDRPEDLPVLVRQLAALRASGDCATGRHVELWLRRSGWLGQDAGSEARA